MTNKILQMQPQKTGLILLGILFLPATLFFQPNLGGEGMSIPHNITVWIAAVLIISAATFAILKSKQFSYPSVWLAMAALPISMIILGFIVDSFLPSQWLFRQLYIFGGFLFLIALFQFRFTSRDIEKVLIILLISGIVHGLYGVSQIFWPNIQPLWITPSNQVPYSTFQQINIHASFQATILLIGFYLLSRPITLKCGLLFQFVLLSSIFLSCFTVAYSGSRTGLLSASTGIITLILCNWRSVLNRKVLFSAVLLTVIAALFSGSQGLQRSSQKLEDLTEKSSLGVAESGSNIRINIYKISVEVFLQQPLSGHGIGSFQKAWHDQKADFLTRFPEANLPPERLSHPHNELIFWMVEGGLLAIGGILASAAAVLYASFNCGWRRGSSYVVLLTPIGLHTMVELPFYISNIPWFLLLLLVYLIQRHNIKTKPLILSRAAELTIGLTATLFCLATNFIMLQTIHANNNLIRFLNGGMAEPALLQPTLANPFFRENAEFYLMHSLLLRELNAQQRSFTPQYIDWACGYIEHTPMPQLYIDLSRAYLATGEKTKAIETIEEGLARYPKIDRLKQSALLIREAATSQQKRFEESNSRNNSKTSEQISAALPAPQPETPAQ